MGDYGFVIGVILFTAVALFVIPPPKKRKYVGTGMVLEYRLGYIYVASRLLEGPAGRAGVKIESRLVQLNEAPMCFDNREEFDAVWESVRPKRKGDRLVCHFEFLGEPEVVTLLAEEIDGDIPVYIAGSGRRFRWGTTNNLCLLTGQISRRRRNPKSFGAVYA